MAVKAGDIEQGLIESLGHSVGERLGQEPPASYREFVRQYYHWVPAKDLADRDQVDLCGAVVSHWRTARTRARGEAKVRVYNPERERDGWESPYTAVEVVSDDMPFIVDSVTMELSRQGAAIELIIHPVMRVVRDPKGELTEVLEPGGAAFGFLTESVIHVEVAGESDPERLSILQAGVELVLEEVRAAVEDWASMRAKTTALATELRRQAPPGDSHHLAEAQAFLAWLADEHFTFLGYREYELHSDDESRGELRAVDGSGLGILRGSSPRPVKSLRGKALTLARSIEPLVLTKANSRATVHRPSYLDYVGVKQFSPDGRVVGERRFLGLYTTKAYKTSPQDIPLLRDKVERVLAHAAFPPDSHDAKGLIDILETLPRDLLVQIDADDLFEIAIGILGLGERQRVRLFVTRDQLDRFVACTLCFPRDRFNTENRLRAGQILAEAFRGDQVDWRLQLSESLIVRVDYVVHCPDGVPDSYDVAEIEARIAEKTRAWTDQLRAAVISAHGEQHGRELYARYGQAFPPGYRADRGADTALLDIDRIEELLAVKHPIIDVYRRPAESEHMIRCQLLSAARVSLSDVVPTFEHMGAKVVDERPYEVSPHGCSPMWIYDFGLSCDPAGMARAGESFAEVLLEVWSGELEDDGLNGLVMAAGLSGRGVTVIRAILRYLRQATVAFSDSYMIRTVVKNAEIAVALVELFEARFDPDRHDAARAQEVVARIESQIDAVQSLDEDRILRSFLAVLQAMLRTNFFRVDQRQEPPRPASHLSFKLDPAQLEMLPKPRPRFEIFVYSPRVEGIHLRGGRVARGGLRWSDRREDFRTEVLGLMKAQMVKNALIVPVGSKGGFVVKRPPAAGGSDLNNEAIACYQTFLRGLLDLTDNYVGAEVVSPDRVVRYDDDDPYLVVAADKGTATFSDIANAVAAEYGFWLGDGFASGGSHGYDHKQMGITARGAWESVKRHFRELGTDVQSEPFSVVGIGDMSGDVFGNGMLRSPHTRLLAAFNHMHVFLDPDPDPAASFQERQRLFSLGRSSWSDYDRAVISAGGGIYLRSAKSIQITDEVKAAFGIEADSLSPADLIRRLLCAPVDLLFNGGIGTYVKAATETQGAAGDRANDAVRVDGGRLRCRVVGEGGNLGFTQRGRIEYALSGGPESTGGRINTDAIDNVAGVNCSDHEVNIKILLADVIAAGEMTDQERNRLLVQMTDAVGDRVRYGSYTQTQAMSLATVQSVSMLEVHARLIRRLEKVASLDREIEDLPTEKAIATRHGERRGLVGPELATLMAYGKIFLYTELLESDLPDDPYLIGDLERYFPPPLAERFPQQIRAHRLRRELIATIVANQLVDRAGMTFAFRLSEETGAKAPQLARAYAVARDVFGMRDFWADVEALDNKIDAGTQLAILIEGRRLVERAARWVVRAGPRGEIDVTGMTERFAPGARLLADSLPGVLCGEDQTRFGERRGDLEASGVPGEIAHRVASMQALLSVFDIVVDAAVTGTEQPIVTEVYFGIGSRLGLDWLRDRILELPRDDRWQALARAALRDELYRLHRSVTREIMLSALDHGQPSKPIDGWLERNAAEVARCDEILADVKESRKYDTTTLPVVLRELRGLVADAGQLT